MRPARGDSKPCTTPDCDGTMRFGRSSDNERPESLAAARPDAGADDPVGWVCSSTPDHFRRS
jgi:hypothetical protein